MIEDKIRQYLEEKFSEEEFSDCFVIEIKLHSPKKLDIFIDSDSGVTFEKCRRISRFLEKHIEEGAWMDERYTLEVSSPGIGRPLTMQRQYFKNVGRKVEVKLKEGGKATGKLVTVEADGITLESVVKRKEGKKKIRENVQTKIEFEDIIHTNVKIQF